MSLSSDRLLNAWIQVTCESFSSSHWISVIFYWSKTLKESLLL